MFIRLIFIFLFLSSLTNSQAQNKTETINWINNKMAASPLFHDGNITIVSFLKINSDGSFQVKRQEFDNYLAAGEPILSFEFTGHFKNLSPSSFRIRLEGSILVLEATCTNSSECIKQKSSFETTISSITLGYVYIDEEQNIQPRLEKAFKHLIKICGGKDDTF